MSSESEIRAAMAAYHTQDYARDPDVNQDILDVVADNAGDYIDTLLALLDAERSLAEAAEIALDLVDNSDRDDTLAQRIENLQRRERQANERAGRLAAAVREATCLLQLLAVTAPPRTYGKLFALLSLALADPLAIEAQPARQGEGGRVLDNLGVGRAHPCETCKGKGTVVVEYHNPEADWRRNETCPVCRGSRRAPEAGRSATGGSR